MAKFLKFLTPKEKSFFPLFEKASSNLLETSKVLCEMFREKDLEKRNILIGKINDLEHVGDNVTHEIMNELSTTFITPFDREDIHELTKAIDDVVDFIQGSSKRILLYKIYEIPEAMIQLSDLIEKGAYHLNIAVHELKNMKNINNIKESLIAVNSIENQADDVFGNAIAKLFEEETNAVNIIKLKEVLSTLETATDKSEDAANVIESIIVKNA